MGSVLSVFYVMPNHFAKIRWQFGLEFSDSLSFYRPEAASLTQD